MDEYTREKRFVDEEKPYWMNLTGGTTYAGPLRFELENYFPEAHYKKAIDEAFQEQARKEVETDGGTSMNHLHGDGRRTSVYYWINPDTGAALYHTSFNEEEADPFFASVGDAEQFLEQTSNHNSGQYEGLSLYEAKIQKVEDAVEVLTQQSGINDNW